MHDNRNGIISGIQTKKVLSMSNPYKNALNTSLRILSRRDHSVAEMNSKLRKRGIEIDVIDRVLAECMRLDYLNDDRFAASLIRHLKRKGCGSLRLRNELNRRGIKGSDIEKLIQGAFGAGEELRIALGVAEKKIRSIRDKDPRKRREKIYRFLYSRGFSKAVIAEATSKVVKSLKV